MFPDRVLPGILLLLGVGFLITNLRVLFNFVRFLKLRSSALLTWRGRKPPFYGFFLALGVLFGCLVLFNVGCAAAAPHRRVRVRRRHDVRLLRVRLSAEPPDRPRLL